LAPALEVTSNLFMILNKRLRDSSSFLAVNGPTSSSPAK